MGNDYQDWQQAESIEWELERLCSHAIIRHRFQSQKAVGSELLPLGHFAKESLLDDLKRDLKKAFGIPNENLRDGAPVRIPVSFWIDGVLDETKEVAERPEGGIPDLSCLEHSKYYAVRISTEARGRNIPQKSKGKRGRRRSQGIENAIEKLADENSDFRNMVRVKQCDAVRVVLFGPDVDHTQPPKDYTDSAIKKRLRMLVPYSPS